MWRLNTTKVNGTQSVGHQQTSENLTKIIWTYFYVLCSWGENMDLPLPCLCFIPLMGPSMLKIYALIELERGLDKICYHCLCIQGLESSLFLGLLNISLGNMYSYDIQCMHWCNTIVYKKGVECSSATKCSTWPFIDCSTIISNPHFTLSTDLLTLLWHNRGVYVCVMESGK